MQYFKDLQQSTIGNHSVRLTIIEHDIDLI